MLVLVLLKISGDKKMKKKIILMSLVLITIMGVTSCGSIFNNSIDLNIPGEHSVLQSYVVQIPIQNASIKVTIDSITVNDDLSLNINITWLMSVNPYYSITKYSDLNNDDMNLTDNLGNTYYMTDAIGAAGSSITLQNKQSCSGSFVYPAPVSGISLLTFNDDDQGKSISIDVSK